MSVAVDVLELLDFVLDVGVQQAEAAGTEASENLANQLWTLGYIDGATAAALKENPLVGLIGFGLGVAATAALATPVGGLEEGLTGAAAEALSGSATKLASSAISLFFQKIGATVLGTQLAAEVTSSVGLMTSIATATINYLIGLGTTAFVQFIDDHTPLGQLAASIFGQSSNIYNNGIPGFGPNLPTNLTAWTAAGGSTNYTVYTTSLVPTSTTVTVSTGSDGDTQAVITIPSGGVAPNSLTLDYGATGSQDYSIIINKGIIDPSGPTLPYITAASDGSPVIGLPLANGSQTLIVNYDTSGIIDLELGSTAGTSGQEIEEYDAADFSGDTIDATGSGSATSFSTEIGPGDTAEVDASLSVAGVSDDYTFEAASGELKLDNPDSFTGTITNLTVGDTIGLAGVTVAGAALGAGNVLSVSAGGTSLSLNLDLSTDYSGESFLIAPDGDGGTDIVPEADGQSIAFTGSNETLLVVDATNLTGTIANFIAGDTVDLAGIVATGATLTSASVLTVQEDSGGTLALNVASVETGQGFATIPDGKGGTDIVVGTLSGNYVFTAFSEPDAATDTGTLAYAINDFGEVVGSYFTNDPVLDVFCMLGFTFDNGVFTTIAGPTLENEEAVIPTGISNSGEVVGNYADGEPSDGGFIYEDGQLTPVTYPLHGIDDNGLVGAYNYSQWSLYSDGNFVPFEGPPPVDGSAEFLAISSNGTILGYDGSYFTEYDGSYQSIDVGQVPGGISGINNYGVMVGSSGGDNLYGFVDFGGRITQVVAPGASSTLVMGINDKGDLTGYAEGYDGSGEKAFVAIPVDSVAGIPCFAAGTQISTKQGEVVVEELRVGDCVQVARDAQKSQSTVWIGHRHVDCRRYSRPRDVWPVRVRAGAFGDALPHRDLWLSPDHAVFFNCVLIPIRYLINEASIAQEERDEVTYWHVELDRHDVILANGLPCESYLDTGNRAAFEGYGGAADRWYCDSCKPCRSY